jgi:NADPH-dependent curcumin reductase CurA
VGDRIARSIVLAARPDGGVKESDFRFETSSVPEPGENEMLLETLTENHFALTAYLPRHNRQIRQDHSEGLPSRPTSELRTLQKGS